MRIILRVLGIILLVILGIVVFFIYNNLNYYKSSIKKTEKAGFKEKQITLKDGDVLNYAEGPNNGPSLFLIHGQCVRWESYCEVLPELSKYYHIYAVDCYGHGESTHNPQKYSAEAMGKDFIWFIENVIEEPVIISGHSSGGLLAAWIGANSPENVKGLVLEDPPLFSSEASRCEKTFAWVDSFKTYHDYLNQHEEDDHVMYYLRNCYWLKFFGKGREGILKYAGGYRDKHPNKKLEIFFLPPSINRTYAHLDSYDPKFGDTFYDCSWMDGFNHKETLEKIEVPTVLIHTSWKYDENGILLGAMSGEDAEKANSLIKNNKFIEVVSGHEFHYENPEEFIKIMMDYLDEVEK